MRLTSERALQCWWFKTTKTRSVVTHPAETRTPMRWLTRIWTILKQRQTSKTGAPQGEQERKAWRLLESNLRAIRHKLREIEMALPWLTSKVPEKLVMAFLRTFKVNRPAKRQLLTKTSSILQISQLQDVSWPWASNETLMELAKPVKDQALTLMHSTLPNMPTPTKAKSTREIDRAMTPRVSLPRSSRRIPSIKKTTVN